MVSEEKRKGERRRYVQDGWERGRGKAGQWMESTKEKTTNYEQEVEGRNEGGRKIWKTKRLKR